MLRISQFFGLVWSFVSIHPSLLSRLGGCVQIGSDRLENFLSDLLGSTYSPLGLVWTRLTSGCLFTI